MKSVAVLVALVSFVCVEAVRIDCEKTAAINEDHIHYCCKHPEGHDDIMDACSKETGFKLPNAKEEAIIDITAERAIAGTCFGKCVFEKFKFMKGEQLDMAAVKRHFQTKHPEDAEYAKEMANAFDHCHGQAEMNTAKFLSNPAFKDMVKDFCDPLPSVIWACVVREFFHNCPAERWSQTQECKDTLAFSKKCKDALTSL